MKREELLEECLIMYLFRFIDWKFLNIMVRIKDTLSKGN